MKQSESEWITRAEAAKRLRVSAMMISKYCAKGMPTRADKRVLWPEAREWVLANMRLRSGRGGGLVNGHDRDAPPVSVVIPVESTIVDAGDAGDDLPPLSVSARRKEAALAKLRELELAMKSGALVSANEVQNWQAHIWTPIIQALTHLPAELRDTHDQMNGRQFEALLRRRIESILASAISYIDECFKRVGLQVSDGTICCSGAYNVKWSIELATPPPSPAPSSPPPAATPSPSPTSPLPSPLPPPPWRKRNRKPGNKD